MQKIYPRKENPDAPVENGNHAPSENDSPAVVSASKNAQPEISAEKEEVKKEDSVKKVVNVEKPADLAS